MDSASDFGSGGWGFESPLGLMIFLLLRNTMFVCFFASRHVKGGVAHSVERSVRNRQAQGSKPCSSTYFVLLVCCSAYAGANGVSVTLKLPKL